jgi:hypothetical protein
MKAHGERRINCDGGQPGTELKDESAYECLRNIDARATRLVVPSDTTNPSDDHAEGADGQSEHVPLSSVSEPICETGFMVRQGERGFGLKIDLLAMKMNIGIA